MSIGNRIKNLRKELNVSVDELSVVLGKNRATIYRYESDDIENLPISILAPLAKALNTTPAYLMGWEDDKEEECTCMIDKENEILEYFSNNEFDKNEIAEIIRYSEFLRSKR